MLKAIAMGRREVSRPVLGSLVLAAPLVLPIILAGFGIVSLGLILLNQFYISTALLCGVPLAIALAVGAYKVFARANPQPARLSWKHPDVLVLVGVLLWVGLNVPFSAQHVLTDRDPATYAVTGAWLATHPGLHIPVPRLAQTNPNVQPESLGFQASLHNDTEIYAQGAHLLPALLGLFGKVIGLRALLAMNVVFGGVALLAFYGFTRLVLRRHWALLSTLVLAMTLPFIYFSRDTYTEPLTLLFIFSALTWLHYAARSKSFAPWLLAGVAAGTTALLRIDSYLLLAALEIYVALQVMLAHAHERRRRLQQAAMAVVPAGLLGLLGWLDVSTLSSGYYHDLQPYVVAQLVLIVAVTVFSAVGIAVAWRTKLLGRVKSLLQKQWIRWSVTALLALFFLVLSVRALFLFAWALLGRATTMNVEIFSAHTTVLWVVWYIGPVLAVAGIWQFVTIWPQLLRGHASQLLPLLLALSADCALYLLKPGISPDQVWASRRFLPIIFPGFIMLGTLLLQRLASQKQLHVWRLQLKLPARNVVLALRVLAVGLPVLTSLPFWTLQPYSQLAQVEAVCQAVPDNALVVWAGDEGAFQIQPTQAFCGVESVATTLAGADLAAALPQLEQAAQAEHKVLYLGANSEDALLLPVTYVPKLVDSIAYSDSEHTYKRFPLFSVSYTNTIVLAPEQPSVAIQP